MKLISDFWSEGKSTDTVIDGPTLSTIMEALNALDGVNRTIISLENNEQSHIVVGGPYHDKYLVYCTLNNRDFFSPKNVDAEPIKVTCFIGGQDGDYRAEQFVPRQVAESAVAYFYKNHGFSPEIDWYSRNGIGPRLIRS